MKKIDLLIGVVIGLVACAIGSYIFIAIFTDFSFTEGIHIMKMQENLGKLITLGAILNLIIFFLLLKANRELMARGVVLAMFILTIITVIV